MCNRRQLALRILFIFLIDFSFASGSHAAEGPTKVTILHTNDHHGHFWRNDAGAWGLPARKTLVDQIRKQVAAAGGHTLLIDAGDVNSGTPESDMAKAEPDFLGMRFMAYDAMAVGNHEFDLGLETLLQQKEWAGFPFLSANIYNKASKKRVFQPYLVMQVGPIKVGILGLTTDDTPQKSLRFPHETLEIRSPIAEARKILPELKAKADVIIALTHMGHYQDGNHGSLAPGDVSLAREVDGIDIIVGGHSQNPLFKADIQNGTYIVQAYEWGKYVGRIDLEINKGDVSVASYQLISVNYPNEQTGEKPKEVIAEDPALLKLLAPWRAKAETIMAEVVGQISAPFKGDRVTVRGSEAALGNLVTAVMKDVTGANAAVICSGVLRSGLPAGTLTFGDILYLHPWSLKYGTYKFSGAGLKDYIEKVANKSPGDGAFPQMSGLKLTLLGQKLVSLEILVDGAYRAVNDDDIYTLALTDFNARGGDGYPVVSEKLEPSTPEFDDAQALKDFIKKHGKMNPDDYAPTGYFVRRAKAP